MGLTVLDVCQFSETDAINYIRRLKWPSTFGGAVCACGSQESFRHKSKPFFRCLRCGSDFSEWTGTSFAGKKLAAQKLLAVIATFANARKGISALQVCRNTGLHYKTAFVTLHKLREVMLLDQAKLCLSGVVEIDGALFGGHRRVENVYSGRFEKRYATAHIRERRVLVVARQRLGRTLTFVGRKEADCVEAIREQLAPGTIIQADGARAWDSMIEAYEMLRIRHDVAYAANDACTNNAESFFSMMRRLHRGTHHKISGELLHAYAAEMAWRQDHRECSPEELIEKLVSLAMNAGTSSRWAGYWQKEPIEKVASQEASLVDARVLRDNPAVCVPSWVPRSWRYEYRQRCDGEDDTAAAAWARARIRYIECGGDAAIPDNGNGHLGRMCVREGARMGSLPAYG